MRSVLKRLVGFGLFCLTPEDSSQTVDWLAAGFSPEIEGALKALVWLGLVSGAAVALC